MNDWRSVDATTSYSMIFFDVECRLDIDGAVARISELQARPLRVCLFSSADIFRPSIVSMKPSPLTVSIEDPSPRRCRFTTSAKPSPSSEPQAPFALNSDSLYNTAAPLFIDSTCPGGLYVDCHQKGPNGQPQRNTVAPKQLHPMPIIGVYDVEKRLTAYRLIPLRDRSIVGGVSYGSSHQRLTWDVEKLWKVDFSEAGWSDHPCDIRFVGSDHHLLIHHSNGDVSGISLFDAQPTTTTLSDAKSGGTNATSLSQFKPPLSIPVTSLARDYQNWSVRESLSNTSLFSDGKQ